MWETFKEFLGLIVFAKPSKKREFMVEALSSHPRNLAKVLNWGAFLLGGFWSIGNKVWIGLLCCIPYIGFVMLIILGIKGNEWAWKSRRWSSVEAFKANQRTWGTVGLCLTAFFVVIGFLIGLSGV
ncbi:hypothetical protein [Nodularia spumigena]|uniref:hypothetical protein n=1 Tax=Nodularia spumigena TaxID=70799 RepID=UPI0000EAD71C|nr:hypothetical protein [Nodularia spumigena]AHJ29827.1 hypothetical protein NSP_35040 [Nodularia spumigena CCY9414]EAW42995.1 hypothetical protein N9414_05854 [Nodularia spumigena CCY9414]MEA5559293.1 hypothetical protein [Nodularia spumigena CH309]